MAAQERPITARDLQRLREKLGLLVYDFCWLLGINMAKWSTLVQEPEKPLPDASLALLVRCLSEHPDWSSVPQYPLPEELLDRIMEHPLYADMPQRIFGIAAGRDGSTSYRWIRQAQTTGPVSDRVLFMMQRMMDEFGDGEGWQRWLDLAEREARARGNPEVWRTGVWTTDELRKERRKARAKRAAAKAGTDDG